MLFADVSWPAKRKIKELPIISDLKGVALILDFISKPDGASFDASIMGGIRSTSSKLVSAIKSIGEAILANAFIAFPEI